MEHAARKTPMHNLKNKCMERRIVRIGIRRQSSACPFWLRKASSVLACHGFVAAAGRSPRCRSRYRLLARHLVVDALDVKIHAKNLSVVEVSSTLALDGLAVLIDDGTLERAESAAGDRGLRLHRQRLHLVGETR